MPSVRIALPKSPTHRIVGIAIRLPVVRSAVPAIRSSSRCRTNGSTRRWLASSSAMRVARNTNDRAIGGFMRRRMHVRAVARTCGASTANGRDCGRGQEALQLAIQVLRAGKIVALRGVGGYQLLVGRDRRSAVAAVAGPQGTTRQAARRPGRLRSRPHSVARNSMRPNKSTLCSVANPIVVCRARSGSRIGRRDSSRPESSRFDAAFHAVACPDCAGRRSTVGLYEWQSGGRSTGVHGGAGRSIVGRIVRPVVAPRSRNPATDR